MAAGSSPWVWQGVGGCCYKEVESGQWGRAEEIVVDRSCCQTESLGDPSIGRVTLAHGRACETEGPGLFRKADYHYTQSENKLDSSYGELGEIMGGREQTPP